MLETDEELALRDLQQLAQIVITRIEKYGTVEGIANSDLFEIIKGAKEILEPLPALIELVSPVIVFGDIHGQLSDMLKFVKTVGRPPDRQLLFLGDYVDRANKGLEVVLWLFCMKIIFPNKIHLLRGNHEIRRVNATYGFRDEMVRKRSSYMWKVLNDVFCELPLVASINRKILCMHGGVSPRIESWNSLTELNKPRLHGACESGLPVDLFWADPNKSSEGCVVNMGRGISCLFGKNTVEQICTALDVDLIIRAHQMKPNGYEFEFDNRLLTVFSAPYYSGSHSNLGAVAAISRSLKLQMTVFKPLKEYKELVAEKTKQKEIVNSYMPLDAVKKKKKITCQSINPFCKKSLEKSGEKSKEKSKGKKSKSCESLPKDPNASFTGKFTMYAHNTKNCKKKEDERYIPFKELGPEDDTPSVMASIKKVSGYGMEFTVADDEAAQELIRKTLEELEAAEAKEREKEATMELMSPSDVFPPPPPPPDSEGSDDQSI